MPNYRKSSSIKTVVSTAAYKCSASFINTNFVTKKQPKDQDSYF